MPVSRVGIAGDRWNSRIKRGCLRSFVSEIQKKRAGQQPSRVAAIPLGQDRERLYSWIEFASVNDNGCSGAKRISLPFVASTVPVPAPPPTPAPIAAPLPPPAMAPIAAPSPAPPAMIAASRFLVDSATSL